ncbi:YciI family protein [Pseudofrankia inefficax]|uniref:YCII-related protein n=1 Tax=Pseudofrankia inefficax (strain DSM 45817 / CECT 9037 / DDB 130130 / EuI1c) TaxID=298654 RepID=E3J1X5_PSEI1|nr:YciI family protein [Pseudofrankia inefficax]ADP84080.1 YCII-related protein [Pseudofrankia inefficax]
MAQYLILIYENEAGYVDGGEAVNSRVMQGHITFNEKNAAAVSGGNALQPEATATSIRSDGAGGFAVTDGPFAETKEALGGYYLIEAANLDEAIAIAKEVPAEFGGVEVRPIRVFT